MACGRAASSHRRWGGRPVRRGPQLRGTRLAELAGAGSTGHLAAYLGSLAAGLRAGAHLLVIGALASGGALFTKVGAQPAHLVDALAATGQQRNADKRTAAQSMHCCIQRAMLCSPASAHCLAQPSPGSAAFGAGANAFEDLGVQQSARRRSIRSTSFRWRPWSSPHCSIGRCPRTSGRERDSAAMGGRPTPRRADGRGSRRWRVNRCTRRRYSHVGGTLGGRCAATLDSFRLEG